MNKKINSNLIIKQITLNQKIVQLNLRIIKHISIMKRINPKYVTMTKIT